MEKIDKEQLELEIKHIFDSGANETRILNMVEDFINKRYIGKKLTIPHVPKHKLEKLHEGVDRETSGVYRYGATDDFDEKYVIEQKVWWGWREMKAWSLTPKGKEEMEAAVKRLVDAGNTVI